MLRSIIEPLEPRTLLSAVKIMPLGDSITAGFDGHATYRYWLWHQLRLAERNVDFVGTARGVWDGRPRFPGFDQDHQAQPGIRADQVLRSIDSWAATHRPDVVLLHIGSNDLFQGQTVNGTINEMAQIIDRLRAANSGVHVLVAQIIPSARVSDEIRELNSRIPMLAQIKDRADSRVIVVDQHSGFDVNTDTYDGIHPNESGERKLAARWFAAIETLDRPAGPNPFLSDLPFVSATNGVGPVERDMSNGEEPAGDGRTIKLNNTRYRKGLGVHAPSDIRFDLAGRYTLFTAEAGIDDEVAEAGSVIFRVYVDWVKVYDSGAVYGRTGTKSIRINVTGAHSLRLVVTDKGDGNESDHATWADARLWTGVPVGGFSSSRIEPGRNPAFPGPLVDLEPLLPL